MTPNVIVVGSINVDLVTYVERLPGPGETVIGGRFSRVHGGKGGNQAVAASRLGARTFMVGVVGRDDLGEAAREELASENVDVAQVRSGNGSTGVAQILVDAGGENLIAVAGGANEELSAGMVRQSFEGIDAPDAVVCAVLEIPEEAVLEAAGQAHERGWPFVLNPAPARPLSDELARLCSVVTPNQHEVSGLGRREPEDLLEDGAGAVVVTMGSEGARLLRLDRAPHHQPAFQVQPVDTTGAGDAFSGALAWGLASGKDLDAAVKLASAAAALSTQSPGARAGMSTREELQDFLRDRS
jgi:ribokinase